ncbi:MAG: transcription repressor NadR, partial [Bacillota bacterium]|nr:transcription repressor NadR [Bacillota bacterium]
MTTDRERTAEKRREYIREQLLYAQKPLTASHFAKELSVSRQVIVGDVAILRAAGLEILATPKGYIISSPETGNFPFTGMLACKHTAEQLRDELYTMVDFGATVIDVTIEHAIYGEISGKLDLSSR